MTGRLLIEGTCDILFNFPIISPLAAHMIRLPVGLQLAEQLAGAPVDGHHPLRVEDLPDVRQLLVPGYGVASLALAGAGVRLVLLPHIYLALGAQWIKWCVCVCVSVCVT